MNEIEIEFGDIPPRTSLEMHVTIIDGVQKSQKKYTCLDCGLSTAFVEEMFAHQKSPSGHSWLRKTLRNLRNWWAK